MDAAGTRACAGGRSAMKKLLLVPLLAVVFGTPARAQLAVVDPANLAQAILIAERTLREYQVLWAQYQTILRMGQNLGNMEGYRIPTIGTTRHDPSRWEYGRPWLQGMNSGDADG